MTRDNTLKDTPSSGPIPKTCAALRSDSPLFVTTKSVVLFRTDYLEVLRALFEFIGWDVSRIPQPEDLDYMDSFENPFIGVLDKVEVKH